jgi:lipopolysaccharide export system protein LptA
VPQRIYRLRRLLAAITVLFSLVVAGMYFYARLRERNFLKEVPGKIGYDIKQTATGFQFSKSDGGRTLFTIEASDLKQFKLNGKAQLHKVSIVLYGRDSSRFDQIYGDDFAYDPKSGDVSANGDVQIDLESNPAGVSGADQAVPVEVKNPIHLKTRDLVFNRESGNASTAARVEFQTPQATGWAVGVTYFGRTNTLVLGSQIQIVLAGTAGSVIQAGHGVISNQPRQVVLEHPRIEKQGGTIEAQEATMFLGRDNNVQHILATGDVIAEAPLDATQNARSKTGRHELKKTVSASESEPGSSRTNSTMRARADRADLWLTGKQNQLQTATLTGNVAVDRIGFQPLHGEAGQVLLEFSGKNRLQTVHATEWVRLTQSGGAAGSDASSPPPQSFELTAPTLNASVSDGHVLKRAETSGPAQITISSVQNPATAKAQVSTSQQTVVTAGKFEATFERTPDGHSRLASVHGAPGARIVNTAPGQPERVSTSDSVDAIFLPQGGIESLTQQGQVAYTDGESVEKRMQAWAEHAHYTPADQILVLAGSPRITQAGMATTADTFRMNRATGEAVGDGNVKSTYSELTEQPNGALLASSSPIHVTARTMTARNNPTITVYSGQARLWQDANIIAAPSIEFDREHRRVVAQGTADHPVSTILVQPEKSSPGKTQQGNMRAVKPGSSVVMSPITITGNRLIYVDGERKAHYEGGVIARGADFTASAETLDVYLLPRSQTVGNQSPSGPGQLDRMVAQGGVSIQQGSRQAHGQMLTYTAAEDKFVLTGGPPSIFDAEQGKITGVSLTFFRGDDRVLVEGEASTPVVTQTRVAR